MILSNKEVFDKFLICNDNLELIMFQVPMFNIVSKKFKMKLSNQQYDSILEKFQQLLENKQIYSNRMYAMCAISLMLYRFVDYGHFKYNQFRSMS